MKILKVLSIVLLAGLVVSLSGASQVWAQEKAPEKAAAPEKSAAPQEKSTNPVVLFKTTMGNFKVELFEKEAPITVKNFLDYVNKKYYDGTIFHRVIPGFVVQGGGFDKDMMHKPTSPPIQNEATNGLKNLKGTLSMARTAEINSATSQFFINLVDNSALDHTGDTPSTYGYAVFGKIIDGWNVIEKIAASKTTTKGQFENVPVEPITVISATVVGGPPKAIETPKAPKAAPAEKTKPAPKAPEAPKTK
jgi:peptidyl-prolyl cis-trans isomerase A (cyclophilin A)